MTLNRGQAKVTNDAINWYRNSPEQIFQIAGGPGTGKSYVLNSIINSLGIDRRRVAPMAFVGAAAIVMRLKGFHNARTVHSWLMSAVREFDHTKKNNYYNRPTSVLNFYPKSLEQIDLIVIDEGYMIPLSLKQTILNTGKKILIAGDPMQLPPVNDQPAFYTTGKIHYIDEIMRQARNSGIVYISKKLLAGESIHNGFYGDCIVLNEDDLTDDMILSSDIIICSKNATRDELNKYVREDLLHIKTNLPMQGEKIVCRRNNWKIESNGISLGNGLTGYVSSFPDVSTFDGKTFTMNFAPNFKGFEFLNILCDYEYFSAPRDKKEKLKYNRYNPGEKFEFAYAITTHMSQGSQYANGIYKEEYMFPPEINRHLGYVGATRFSNFLIYVRQKRKYYQI